MAPRLLSVVALALVALSAMAIRVHHDVFDDLEGAQSSDADGKFVAPGPQHLAKQSADLLGTSKQVTDARQGKPTLFIILGPTGAGKSTVESRLRDLWAVRGDEVKHDDPAMMLIDDLVERDNTYASTIRKFLSGALGTTPTRESITKWVGTAVPRTYTQFENAYFGARKSGCNRPAGGCDDAFNQQLDDLFKKRRSMMFETTGMSAIWWIVNKATLHAYKVVLAMATIPFCDVQERNKNRAIDSIDAFMTSPEAPAPRLPDLTKLSFNVNQIIENTIKYIDCVGPVGKNGFCENSIDEFYVFSTKNRDFTPDVVVVAPTQDAKLQNETGALSRLKDQAKAMLKILEPRACEGDSEGPRHRLSSFN